MPEGFYCSNDYGVVQIDGDYIAYRLKSINQFYVSSATTIANIDPSRDIIVINPVNGSCVVHIHADGRVVVSGGYNYLPSGGYSDSCSGEVLVYTYGTAGNGGYGMDVFNGAGNLVFSSSDSNMNIVSSSSNTSGLITGSVKIGALFRANLSITRIPRDDIGATHVIQNNTYYKRINETSIEVGMKPIAFLRSLPPIGGGDKVLVSSNSPNIGVGI